jgi:ABC-type transporter Mla MlaB component
MTAYAIVGELTVRTVAGQKDSLLAALATGQPLELSLADVTDIDTAGLQLLLAVKREAAGRQEVVRFLNPSAAVQHVLAFVKLDAQLGRAVENGRPRKDPR